MIRTARQMKDLIRNLSKEKSADAHILMRNYMMERFLERISFSEYRDRFVLKGGMLVAAGCPFHKRITPPPVWAAWTWFCTTKEPVLLSAIKAPCLHPSTKRKTTLNYWKRLKVLDKGIIKQLKIQGPTYDKTPPLETMSRAPETPCILMVFLDFSGFFQTFPGISPRMHDISPLLW